MELFFNKLRRENWNVFDMVPPSSIVMLWVVALNGARQWPAVQEISKNNNSQCDQVDDKDSASWTLVVEKDSR